MIIQTSNIIFLFNIFVLFLCNRHVMQKETKHEIIIHHYSIETHLLPCSQFASGIILIMNTRCQKFGKLK